MNLSCVFIYSVGFELDFPYSEIVDELTSVYFSAKPALCNFLPIPQSKFLSLRQRNAEIYRIKVTSRAIFTLTLLKAPLHRYLYQLYSSILSDLVRTMYSYVTINYNFYYSQKCIMINMVSL